MTDQQAFDLLKTPKNNLQQVTDYNERQALIDKIDAIAQAASYLSGYLIMRNPNDEDDQKAKNYAEKRLKAVRKALGFSYP